MKSNDSPFMPGERERLAELRVFSDLVEKAMQRAVSQAIAAHHRAGNPVAIWKEGRVVLWYPDGSYRPVEEASPAKEKAAW